MSVAEQPAAVSQPLPLAVTLTTDHARLLIRIARRQDDHELLSERELEAVKALEAQVGGAR